MGERARTKLLHLLSDDHPDPVIWVARLRSFREFETAPAFASAVRVLFQLELEDVDAERLLEHVLDHRAALVASLGRDPGLRVAAMDYLSNVEKRYANPKIVEMEEFEETERSARTDPLTGLANRRVFDDALDREIRRSRRYGWPLTVVMADLDHFKEVNDAFGHLLGDLVLERIGEILRHAVREADVVSRYGGEEFAIVLPETPRVGGFAVAERIRRRVGQIFSQSGVGGHEIEMSISCGLATYPEDGLHAVEIVARADEALYGAKRAGRNRVCVFHREKRKAFRFPLKAGALVTVAGSRVPNPSALNVSQSGALVEGAPGLGQGEAVTLQWSPLATSPDGFKVDGRVARLEGERAGIAFDREVPEERLMEHVSLARPASRGKRRARR